MNFAHICITLKFSAYMCLLKKEQWKEEFAKKKLIKNSNAKKNLFLNLLEYQKIYRNKLKLVFFNSSSLLVHHHVYFFKIFFHHLFFLHKFNVINWIIKFPNLSSYWFESIFFISNKHEIFIFLQQYSSFLSLPSNPLMHAIFTSSHP